MKQVMGMLLQMPANTAADYNKLVENGLDLSELDEDTVNNMLVVNTALLQKAKAGDVQAIKELRSIMQDDHFAAEKLKIEKEKLKLEREKLLPAPSEQKTYTGIPANLIAPAFSPVLFDIAEHEHSEYVFPGGRGSTKSSFISLNVIDLIMNNPEMHACVLREVANTLKDHGAVAQPVTSDQYGEPEKIPLSNDFAVSLFFNYGVQALTPDLMFKKASE